MEPSAAPLDTTPDPAIVQPPGASPPVPPREQQQEQLRIGESGQFSEGLEDRAVSVMRYSASSFGFAFDATLDVLSSAIVLWRYSNAAAVHSAHREYIACVILGVIFLLSSICIVIKAIHDLAKKVLPEVDDFLYSVSVLSGILCTVLAVIKFMLGKVLTSRALITDGFNSLVGGIMGFSILLSAEVFKHNSSVWYLDGSIGVLIGLTIFAYGVKLLIDMIPRVRQTRHYEMFE
ncbi:transmembrane protein 163 isoform X2 [Falco biarmicus]|uniref:transmembrane protein 163 isoform X2 n=1 Tax=Falco rusticolus TaxID=120794 RepID=UPI001886A01B|nr:transmembrane protein 163 isoform X2 [Falco rusticolus]XP_040459450.1 transmembrane protein 163 isoform X2 [Falco naumanni]XP_055574060.1 transmembrane protein 163 isoform X2 [Falco cherrug]XP_056204602.1 transmembrane protein 163 isoform X2 [Falco biarmicus]